MSRQWGPKGLDANGGFWWYSFWIPCNRTICSEIKRSSDRVQRWRMPCACLFEKNKIFPLQTSNLGEVVRSIMATRIFRGMRRLLIAKWKASSPIVSKTFLQSRNNKYKAWLGAYRVLQSPYQDNSFTGIRPCLMFQQIRDRCQQRATCLQDWGWNQVFENRSWCWK